MADQLRDNPPAGSWDLVFTAYVDAVTHDSLGESEERLPPGTEYHVNYYQTHFGLNGEPTAPDPAYPNAVIRDVNVTLTTWGANLDHYLIDDHQNVQERIRNGHGGAGDPQHDGLTDRVPK